jgi:hypothetical protein
MLYILSAHICSLYSRSDSAPYSEPSQSSKFHQRDCDNVMWSRGYDWSRFKPNARSNCSRHSPVYVLRGLPCRYKPRTCLLEVHQNRAYKEYAQVFAYAGEFLAFILKCQIFFLLLYRPFHVRMLFQRRTLYLTGSFFSGSSSLFLKCGDLRMP